MSTLDVSSLSPVSAFKSLGKDLTSAPSFGHYWDSMRAVDPGVHLALNTQSRRDDNVTAKLTSAVGLNGVSDYFQHAADDPTQGVLHHALAGLAYLGASAAGSAIGGGSAGTAGGVATAASSDTAMGGAAGTLGAADSSAASAQLGLTAGDVAGTSGATAGASTAAGSGGSLLGNLSLAQKAELGVSALNLAKSALTPAPNVGTAAPVAQLPQSPESQGGNAMQALMSGSGQAGGAPGVAQTLLTGAGGVDPNSLGLGKNTLLGS